MPFSGAITALTLLLFVLPGTSAAQQAAATGEPLVVRTTNLPRGYLRQPYRAQLEADGGITPLKWELTNGSLPAGLTVAVDGLLSGIPTEPGLFHFTVTVTDSGNPAHQRNQELTLQVVAPLVVEWSRYPRVTGQRVEGAIKEYGDRRNDPIS